MYHNFFIHPSVSGYLSCLHVLAIVNSAAANTGVHTSLSVMVFSEYMPSNGIVGSYGLPGGASGKEPPPLGWEAPLEEEMATHSRILA